MDCGVEAVTFCQSRAKDIAFVLGPLLNLLVGHTPTVSNNLTSTTSQEITAYI
jgi:hypothetical protein